MEIHQVVVSASPADAVTNAAFEVRELLRRIGTSEIFARYIHDDLAGDIFPLEEYQRLPSARAGGNLLIYHASIGEPAVKCFLEERPERLVLVYHNITPPEYFAIVQPRFSELLAGGRIELAALRDRVLLALAASAYNARELEALGYRDVRVSPLIIEAHRLCAMAPTTSAMEYFQKHLHGPLLLFVGQLMPHKRPDLLLAAYHVLVTHLMPEAVLAMVGPCGAEPYGRALSRYVKELNLERAWLPGRVKSSDLAAYFRTASVFVTLSEHEGFCVPLVEAMAFGLPIVARSYAAIPETLGGAGLLLPSDDDPALIAEALSRVLTDHELRRAMVAAGTERLADFRPDVARAVFLAHLTEVA